MAQLKAHEVDAYLKNPADNHKIFLVYGPDIGSVSEKATILAKSSKADLSDPFSTIKIDADDAAADPSRLADEAHTVSMFGGKRLIWVQGKTLKNLANAIQPIIDLPPQDSIVVIEAGDLKKSSPLRSRIEKSSSAIALPCYVDADKALVQIINEEIQIANLTIEPNALNLLKSLIGGDRLASRKEIQKLCLYASDKGKITEDDIFAIVGDASSLAVETVVDSASIGDIATMEKTFKKLIARGTSEVQIASAMQRHFQMLHLARSKMDAKRMSVQSVIGGMRPPVNFQRKAKVERALSIWRLDALTRTLSRLEKTSLDARAGGTLSSPLTATTLLAVAIEANRSRR